MERDHTWAATTSSPFRWGWPLLVLAAAAMWAASGCAVAPLSDPAESGRLGLTINEAGEPVFVLHVCSLPINTISAAAIPDDEMAAWPITDYIANRSLEAGIHEINPARPPSGWQIGRIQRFDDPAQLYALDAADPGSTGFVSGLRPTGAQVAALRLGQVLIGIDGETGARSVTRSAFEAEACDDPSRRL
ncbi:hypothetical protein EDD33_1889 [Nocardioides aurantiacus]|uniref:Uncharacterized protein n=2 Tax=Nocardioides aurantiacus TaxID=86796 RepID=A0A3N2CU24_9ACTN|nr:hypothetical protein EDD33_1889 [Nocardioides aurantiacus]